MNWKPWASVYALVIVGLFGAHHIATANTCPLISFATPSGQVIDSMGADCSQNYKNLSISDITGTTTISHIGKALNQSVSVGTLALGTKTVTVTGLTGLLAGDICTASPAASTSLTVGLILAGCQSTTNGQAILTFATPIVLGVSVGTLSVNISWIG